jgi:hypothetical protein
MKAGRAPLVLAFLAAAGVLAAVAAWFLGGGGGAPPETPPAREGPRPDSPKTSPPQETGRGRPVRSVRPAPGIAANEEDAPPDSRIREVPKGWKPWVRLRLLDAVSKGTVPLELGEGVRGKVHVRVLVGADPVRRFVTEPFHVAEDGTVEVFSREYADGGVLPFGISKEEWDRARVEVRVRGYEPREFPSRAELSGDRDVVLTPSAPSVTGVLLVAPALAGKRVSLSLEPADPARNPRVPDLQPWVDGEDAGPFAWYDVPDGKWRLDVWVSLTGNDLAHARRDFEKAGSRVDLGEIAIHPPSVVRVRVVARDGTGVLDQGLTLEHVPTGAKENAVELDEQGWTEFRNLDADTDYRLASSLDDGVAETIHTPVAGGGAMKVELKWDNEGVRCRLKFTVDGEEPIQWGDLFEGPALDKGAWKKDGFLEHDMGAGEYLLGAWARPRGKDKPIRVFARFTVPSQPLWEATIDMKEDAEK